MKSFRVFQFAANVPWMITEPALRTILEVAARVNPPVAQIEAELGRELVNDNNYQIEDGVAIIPVIGPIFRYADMFTQISGATSVTSLTKSFDAALNDDAVNSILLNIDSPGGEANGINEFAEKIFESRDIKPIESYVSGSGCSAAYWIASATRKITSDDTASIGSIGVAAVIQDTEEADAREGIKNIKFVSSKSPNKRPDLNTDEGRNVIQENIDAMADVFIEKVARNRGVTANDVVERFGHGGVSVGRQAVNCGLADQLGSYNSALSSLKDGISSTNKIQENLNMSLKDTVKSEFEGSGAVAENAIVATEIAPTLIDGKTPAEVVAELAQLRGLVADSNKAKEEALEVALKVKAEQAATTFLSDNKIVPAQQDVFVSSYIQASKDDEKSPIQGFSRVDSFLSMFDTKAPNIMTEEMVDPLATATLLAKQEDDAKSVDDALVAQANAYAKKVKAIG